MRQAHLRYTAFTLVEVLVSVTILASMLLVITTLLSAINRSWIAGEQQVSEFQDGRAIVEIIARELAQASVSPSLQFVQNPPLPSNANQRANSDSIFWQAPIASTSAGNLAEIGYYLTADYQLMRFYVPPTDTTDYLIFSPAGQPTEIGAPWVTNVQSLSNPVGKGILAFWIRCFDTNGDLIPWYFNNGGTQPLKFNSLAHFKPATPGISGSFTYVSQSPTATARANVLPATVELTIVSLDSRTFARAPNIPAQIAQNSPDDLPSVRDAFSGELLSNGIRTAHAFSTRVKLANAPQ